MPPPGVALYTSAWIEIVSRSQQIYSACQVALYTSAWIEIPVDCLRLARLFVALYTSAWIEIVTLDQKP